MMFHEHVLIVAAVSSERPASRAASLLRRGRNTAPRKGSAFVPSHIKDFSKSSGYVCSSVSTGDQVG